MFLENQEGKKRDYYSRLLEIIGSLSRLFSESPEPYIPYRVAENLFCHVFGAENLSRSDVSVDASKDGMGFGIKTFLNRGGRSFEKIAEFNSAYSLFQGLDIEDKVRRISELRNERVETTRRIFKLDSIIYHCVVRSAGKIAVYELPVQLIDIDRVGGFRVRGNVIQFSDSCYEYSFNVAKSVLYERFVAPDATLLDVAVVILGNPFERIGELSLSSRVLSPSARELPHVFLPLYSMHGESKTVPVRSGLNQWNAGGRPRDPNEVYVPIPAWIHRRFPDFFPQRDQSFALLLPSHDTLSAKICQDNNKALMSNPNSALGEWLLRSVLKLGERELLTYGKLQAIGLDSVVIRKSKSGEYDIDFTKVGSYEQFVVEEGGVASGDGALENDAD